MILRLFLLLLPAFLFSACAPKPTAFQQFLIEHPEESFEVLIVHGEVIDGTGKAAYPADILIRGDSIVYMGEVDTTQIQVKKVLDATGQTVTPGFIDTHAHGDPLTEDFSNFLAMGVTTVALGNDGESPENLETWMQQVATAGPLVNVGVFAGHGTLRMESGLAYDSVPSQAQLAKMGQLLQRQLTAGALGLSTGLEYVPGLYAPAYELEYLAKIVGKNKKLITSHLRNEDNDAVEASIRELLAQGRHCAVHVSHLKVVFGKGKERAQEILELLEQALKRGQHVTADVYPYTASFTGIGLLFPDWALPPHPYRQVVATRRPALATYLRERVNKRNGPAATLIGTAPFAGKTLAQLAQEKRKPFEDVLMDDIGPEGASAAYFVMDEALQVRLLLDSTTIVCSDGGPTMRHPRGYGSFAKIIEEYVLAKKLLSLEEAVRKMTSLPAATIGVTDRGVLAVGKKADLLIFDPAKVKAQATYENPFQLATGFSYVLINGKISLPNRGPAVTRHGMLLRNM